MTNTIHDLTALGQSLWYDNIQRRLLENGELAALIANGDIRGVTSNPTIFHNAIAKTHDYDSALTPLAIAGWSAGQIFWQLACEDIQAACDLFLPLYEQVNGKDGFVSIEVSPYLANDTDGTIAQAKELWARINRPNLMVKIPATKAGIPAIRAVIAAGINVNVTLIFSLERYGEVMEAYLSGLEDRHKEGGEIGRVASVASFFISRLDSKVDPRLPEDSPLRGKAAIANARLAYDKFSDVFSTKRFEKLRLSLGRAQRPLWASTGTKNPAYPDTLYVDALIGPDTVNTVPPATLDAYRDHGTAAVTVMDDVEVCEQQIAELEKLGISMATVTEELEAEGVKSFTDAFTALLQTVDERRQAVINGLGSLVAPVSQRIIALESANAIARMNAIDPTLWTDDAEGQKEIKIRLGWLGLPETSRSAIAEINGFVAEVRTAGISRILLIGMGGSSLAPEVFSLVFADVRGETPFAIVDSTDPGQVLATAAEFPIEETLVIVSSKSGGTSEVNANFNYFWSLAEAALGEKAGEHFVAITDPSTALEAMAKAHNFRKIFTADPTVGGRYSALTHFGLVPAALMGIDIEKLLANAATMAAECGPDFPAARNPGLVLGAVMGQAALEGRDKLTIITDPALASVGSWLEQLIAESTGKLGKGVVPVDLEPLGPVSIYGHDRWFVYLRKDGQHDAALAALGQPVMTFDLSDPYTLGGEIYRWEVATAIGCAVLEVNPFDQPDVQDAKNRTKAKIAEFREKGKLDMGSPATLETAPATLKEFIAKAKHGDYVAINAYLPRNPAIADALTALRTAIRAHTHCATTVGFGPRFLHSTGQLHKGGADNGMFIQITADPVTDADIPTENMSYGTLERAQSLGDFEALLARERRALRIHLPNPEAVQQLVDALQ